MGPIFATDAKLRIEANKTLREKVLEPLKKKIIALKKSNPEAYEGVREYYNTVLEDLCSSNSALPVYRYIRNYFNVKVKGKMLDRGIALKDFKI